MKIEGEEFRSLWYEKNKVHFIDQRKLPYKFCIYSARTIDEIVFAIRDMVVRGAPAIGAAASYGMVLGVKDIINTSIKLRQTRPTAHDLFFAIKHMEREISAGNNPLIAANKYVDDIISRCKKIGENGEKLIKNNMKILTHCNAGALATVDYGTALAPIRIAYKKNKNILVYADETRPRCQGYLTSWELKQEGIKHHVIVDNASGYYMKNGEIDIVIVGADRIAKNGDFANKIGTYEKAVVAKENNVPFYVAAPISTFDKKIKNGKQIKIEEREKKELREINKKRIMPDWIPVMNPSFDVTPSKYVTGYITEKGIIKSL